MPENFQTVSEGEFSELPLYGGSRKLRQVLYLFILDVVT